MSITVEQIKNVIVKHLDQDAVLSQLNNVMRSRSIPPDQALKIATYVAAWAASKGGSEAQVIAYAVDAYKAAAYQQVHNAGDAYNDDRHTKLVNAWEQVGKILAEIRSQQSGGLGGIGGLGGGSNAGGLLGGNSSGGVRVTDGLTMSSAPSGGVKIGNTDAALTVIAGGEGLNLVNDPILNPQPAQVAPAQQPRPEPAPVPVQPMPVSNATVNNPVLSPLGATEETEKDTINGPINNILQEIDLMEDYALHELKTPELKMSIPAKEANSRIKQSVYAETRDWATPLQDIFNGNEEVVFYDGADLIVRARDSYRAYLVGVNTDMCERMKQFVAKHDALKSDLDNLALVEDVETIMAKVKRTIDELRKNTKELHEYAIANSSEAEVVISEISRFANAYLANITFLVHNALSLGTKRGKDVPKFKAIDFERKISDIDFFVKDLFTATAGDNGVSEYEDWFRDLFLMVANSLRKLTIKLSDSGKVVNLIQSQFTIVIPGMYHSVDKHDVVTVASLGNTADPVVSIYEAVQENVPHAIVLMQLPQRTYLLLSNGEKTAPVLY
ncbi:hypothetical protein BZX62_02685 [Salmonella enterica subsp. enterica serovar Enteritidis]|nr:hypothetical protein [Salmonella enterica subsp. enterica serovar Enteritidis]